MLLRNGVGSPIQDARTGLTVALLLAGVLAACGSRNEPPPPPTAPMQPNVVTFSTADYKFQAPDTIRAGWTTLRFANNGNDIHYAHIVRLDSAKSPAELVAAYAAAIKTSGARPKWVKRFGGPGGTAPGDTSAVTQYLEAGSYVWICPVEDEGGNPHFGKGEYKPFVVQAASPDARQDAARPRATATIRQLDFSFAFDPALQAGHHTIRVENAGEEPHDLTLLKLLPGGTLEQVQAWLNPEKARRPGQSNEPGVSPENLVSLSGGIAVIGPGMEAFFDADLTPGEYVLACMATAPDGRSHIEHGMIQQISIR